MLIVANSNNETCGVAHKMLQLLNVDIPIVLISKAADFKFNEQLLGLDRYILCDYVEYGWDWDRESHLFGRGQTNYGFNTDEWKRFDDFVATNKPLLYFKRELLKTDVSETVKPIEYPKWVSDIPAQKKEEFDQRPIALFNFWGRSNEERVLLQGKIYAHATKRGFSICDNLYYLNAFLQEEKGEKWVTVNIPHYARIPIEHILPINGLSKLSVSLPGAGIKCFRSTGESPANAVMITQEDELSWTYEWVHNENCIKAIPGQEITAIEDALNNPNLYEIYLSGVQTANKYNVGIYLQHIEKLIQDAL